MQSSLGIEGDKSASLHRKVLVIFISGLEWLRLKQEDKDMDLQQN